MTLDRIFPSDQTAAAVSSQEDSIPSTFIADILDFYCRFK